MDTLAGVTTGEAARPDLEHPDPPMRGPSMPEPSARVRPTLLDPVGLLAVAAAAVVFLTRGWEGVLSRDLALYAYAGQRVADGEAPYVGVMNRAGPLAHLVPGLGAWLGRVLGFSDSGGDDLRAQRVLFFALSLALVWCVYLLVRDVLDSRLAGLAGAAVLVMNPGIITYATGGPREKTAMLLLLTLMLLACRHHRFGWTGILLALATLTWQPVFFPGIVAAAGCALLDAGYRRAALLRVAVGGVATTAVFLAYFWAVGALRVAYDGFVAIHLRHTSQPGIDDDPTQAWRDLVDAFGDSAYVLVVGLAAALVAAPIVWLLRRHITIDLSVVVFALAAITGMAWSYRTFNGWADALVLFPFAALGVGAIVIALRALPLYVGQVATTAAICVALVWGFQTAGDRELDDLPKQQTEVDRVFDVVPDASIQSIEAPQPLVLGRRVNPSPHQMFRLGIQRYVAEEHGGLARFADTIADERPTLIAVGLQAHYWWLRPVLEDYEQFGTSPGWYWYVSDNVDSATRDRLADAVRG